MSEAILKKLEKEAVASVAVAEALQGHAVHAILARSGDRRRRGVVRTILEQQVFINEAMEVGLDLALARWNRGPKAEEFFTRMKDDILDGREDLRVSLENVGTSWAEVKSSTAAIPACQAYASAFVHLFATQPDAHCAICSLINFKLWNEMCKTVLAAAPKDSGPYIERFAKRAGDQTQVGERLPSRLLAIAIADEASLSSQTPSGRAPSRLLTRAGRPCRLSRISSTLLASFSTRSSPSSTGSCRASRRSARITPSNLTVFVFFCHPSFPFPAISSSPAHKCLSNLEVSSSRRAPGESTKERRTSEIFNAQTRTTRSDTMRPLTADGLEVLLEENRALQAHLEGQVEKVRKQIEENRLQVRKVNDLRKSLEYRDKCAQGLEVVWHKDLKPVMVPLANKVVEVPSTRYFVSKSNTVPKPNEDAVRLSELYSRMPIPFDTKAYEWTPTQRGQLRDQVKEAVVRMKMRETRAAEGAESRDGLLRNYQNLYEECRASTTLSTDEDRELLRRVDWDKVAEGVGGGKKASDCEWQWKNLEDPVLPSVGFTAIQGDKLMEIAKDCEMRDWDKISRLYESWADGSPMGGEVGTNVKRPVDCLRYIQKNRKRRAVGCKWSEEEDRALLRAIKAHEIFDGQWNKWVSIAAALPDKTSKQCLHRWKNVLLPRQRRREVAAAAGEDNSEGKRQQKPRNVWTKPEDELLVAEVAKKGKNWSVVAKAIENKSDRQCRERYLLVDPELKQGEWTDEEILELHSQVKKYYNAHDGAINWDYISRQLRRSSNHCRKRWCRVLPNIYRQIVTEVVAEVADEAMREP